MNSAGEKRNKRISLLDDLALLERILGDETGALSESDRVVFFDMLRYVERGGLLSIRQRTIAKEACERITPIRACEVPRGRAVPTPDVLRNLPKSPPGRRP